MDDAPVEQQQHGGDQHAHADEHVGPATALVWLAE
jgi:hypothetical protein